MALLVLGAIQVGVAMVEFRGGLEGGRLWLSLWVWGLVMLVGAVAVILVIQKDIPFGRTEFWSSRPVSRGAMLASKLVVLGLVLLLLGVSWVLPSFLTGSEADWSLFGLSFLLAWAWMLVAVAALSSLSSGLVRMFINAAILGAAVVGTVLLLELLFSRRVHLLGGFSALWIPVINGSLGCWSGGLAIFDRSSSGGNGGVDGNFSGW